MLSSSHSNQTSSASVEPELEKDPDPLEPFFGFGNVAEEVTPLEPLTLPLAIMTMRSVLKSLLENWL